MHPLNFQVKIESRHVILYLNNYFICTPSVSFACTERLQTFKNRAEELGIPLAGDKTEGPNTSIIYLEIKQDTVPGPSSLSSEVDNLKIFTV